MFSSVNETIRSVGARMMIREDESVAFRHRSDNAKKDARVLVDRGYNTIKPYIEITTLVANQRISPAFYSHFSVPALIVATSSASFVISMSLWHDRRIIV